MKQRKIVWKRTVLNPRAHRAMNCRGHMIWVSKPRLFRGKIWHLRVSTIERSIAFVARREFLGDFPF